MSGISDDLDKSQIRSPRLGEVLERRGASDLVKTLLSLDQDILHCGVMLAEDLLTGWYLSE